MFASFFLGALYLEHVLGYSAIHTGLAFLPMTLSIGVLSVGVTPRLLNRFGPKRTLIPGLAMALAGLLVFARVPIDADYWTELFPAFLLIGLGAGTSFMPLITLAMSEVPKPDAGLASGLVNVSQQMAAAVGIAVLGTLAASRTAELLAAGHSPADALTCGYRFAFLIARRLRRHGHRHRRRRPPLPGPAPRGLQRRGTRHPRGSAGRRDGLSRLIRRFCV